MLEVHPPHHPTHTWRDFFIHIATICVGLLIALGLEQAVEAVHRARLRHELRESLAEENERIVRDCVRTERAMVISGAWAEQVEKIISEAQLHHTALPPLPGDPNTQYDTPDDPVYRAAKASDELNLLSRAEIEAYSEVEGSLEGVHAGVKEHDHSIFALRALHRIGSMGQPADAGDFVHASPEDWKALYNGYLATETAAATARFWARFVRGAEMAIIHGETNLEKIQAAERQFDNQP